MAMRTYTRACAHTHTHTRTHPATCKRDGRQLRGAHEGACAQHVPAQHGGLLEHVAGADEGQHVGQEVGRGAAEAWGDVTCARVYMHLCMRWIACVGWGPKGAGAGTLSVSVSAGEVDSMGLAARSSKPAGHSVREDQGVSEDVQVVLRECRMKSRQHRRLQWGSTQQALQLPWHPEAPFPLIPPRAPPNHLCR